MKKRLTPSEQRALDLVRCGTKKLPGEGFEVSLPWKNGEPSLVNNKEAAIQQFARGAMRKFLVDPEYKEEYRRTLFEYINEGYAKKNQLKTRRNLKDVS